MTNFFKKVLNKADKLEDDILGPDYPYQEFIKNPGDLGMSGAGNLDALSRDINGIMSYVKILISGTGNAKTKNPSVPLGNKFFIKTGGKCKDYSTGEAMPRYMYVNNIPSSKVPIISNLAGMQFKDFRGIVPGIAHNMYAINPVKMFGAFMQGTEPLCAKVKLEQIGEDGRSTYKSHHVPISDLIDLKNNLEIPGDVVTPEMMTVYNNSISEEESTTLSEEGFTTLCNQCKTYSAEFNEEMIHNELVEEDSNNKNSIIDKVYLTSISLLIMYIFYKFYTSNK